MEEEITEVAQNHNDIFITLFNANNIIGFMLVVMIMTFIVWLIKQK